jgi:thiol-disulfide isomerase/thioredoxin
MNNTKEPLNPCGHNDWPYAVLRIALAACIISGLGQPARADREPLKLMLGGASTLTRLRSQELMLSPTRPSNVKRIPARITAPFYTTLQLGPKDNPSRFTLLVDAPEGKPSRIFVDANGNGDLTDDPAPEWIHKTYAGRENDHLLVSVGGATLQVRYGKEIVPLRVTLSRYDTTEPARAAQFQPIYCTADYAREGKITLAGKAYHIWLADALTRGDFRGSGVAGQSGIFLLIDVNGNGKIDPRGEIYDAAEPFNIGGVTYEIHNLDAAGTAIEIEKSARQVAEMLPPPDLSIGKHVPAFQATATNGRSVKFPDDYKGKLVLVYFWATWCGDCNREAPYVTRAYATNHAHGLEILGISLDHPNQQSELAEFTREHGMDWPQIYDGKVWDAAIAQLYFISHTPTGLLVDGDSGTVIATGADLMGDRLAETIKKSLGTR